MLECVGGNFDKKRRCSTISSIARLRVRIGLQPFHGLPQRSASGPD